MQFTFVIDIDEDDGNGDGPRNDNRQPLPNFYSALKLFFLNTNQSGLGRKIKRQILTYRVETSTNK